MEGKRTIIPRGTVRFGGAAPEPEKNGVWIGGAVKTLDLDGWIALARAGGGDARVEWGGVELKADAVDLFGRRFNQLALTAVMQGGLWRGTVAGKELEGNASWDPQGQGRIVARMKTVSDSGRAARRSRRRSPPPRSRASCRRSISSRSSSSRTTRSSDGSSCSPRPGTDSWRIEKLRITNPDAVFTAEGMWQAGLAEPRTQISLRLDTPDAGKLLTRLGYPEGVRRGKAKLEGALAWTGAPYEFDYPTLSGGLLLEVGRGQFTKLESGHRQAARHPVPAGAAAPALARFPRHLQRRARVRRHPRRDQDRPRRREHRQLPHPGPVGAHRDGGRGGSRARDAEAARARVAERERRRLDRRRADRRPDRRRGGVPRAEDTEGPARPDRFLRIRRHRHLVRAQRRARASARRPERRAATGHRKSALRVPPLFLLRESNADTLDALSHRMVVVRMRDGGSRCAGERAVVRGSRRSCGTGRAARRR